MYKFIDAVWTAHSAAMLPFRLRHSV